MGTPRDVRLVDRPMEPLTCGECAARVLVRKSSWEQTSIQWTSEALAACRERTAFGTDHDAAEQFAGCEALQETIREATTEGTIEVIDRDVPRT